MTLLHLGKESESAERMKTFLFLVWEFPFCVTFFYYDYFT